LLHITDMAWKRVHHPSEVVNVGDELDVRVLRFDRDRNRVETVIAFFKVCEDPGAINLTEKEPDLVDAAGALGTGKVVEWIYKFYVEAKEAQSA